MSYLHEDQAGWFAGSEGQASQGVRGTVEPQRPGRVSFGADPHEAGVTRLVAHLPDHGGTASPLRAGKLAPLKGRELRRVGMT